MRALTITVIILTAVLSGAYAFLVVDASRRDDGWRE